MKSTASRWESDGELAVLRLRGSIDASAEAVIVGEYLTLQERAKHVLIDFHEVRQIDSTGVGLLISVWSLARAAGHNIAWFGMPPNIARVFAVLRLPDNMVRICATEQEARNAVGANAQ